MEALIFLVPFYATILFSIMPPNSSITVFAWVLIIPILAPLLLGRNQIVQSYAGEPLSADRASKALRNT